MAKEQVSVKLPPVLAKFISSVEGKDKMGTKSDIIQYALYKLKFEYEKELEEKERIKMRIEEILTEDEALLREVMAKIAPKLSKETKQHLIEVLK